MLVPRGAHRDSLAAYPPAWLCWNSLATYRCVNQPASRIVRFTAHQELTRTHAARGAGSGTRILWSFGSFAEVCLAAIPTPLNAQRRAVALKEGNLAYLEYTNNRVPRNTLASADY